MRKVKNMNAKLLKVSAVLAASLLAVGLAACSAGGGGDERPADTSDAAALIETQPSGADEAAKLYAQLMQKENEVLSSDSQLWEKLFLSASKESPMVEDGSNYGDFLLATLESAKDKFTAQEQETLKTGAEQIKQIEDKLAALEREFPGCGSTPGQGESVDAQSAGMTAKAEGAEKFPSFNGKDLDGNDVNSDELFSNNTVTVVNFWFTTCKPCVGELGELEALNQKLAEKGGAVVGINSFTLDGDKTATFTLTVKEAATSVTLDKTAIELSVGASETLAATIAPSGADDAVEWTTSDETVATVDENGKVTAVKAGTATITVTTKNGKTATCTVTVKAEEKEDPVSGGCGSAVAATASALGALLVAGAVVVLFRKK